MKWRLIALVACLAALTACGDSTTASVTTWAPGNPQVSGSVHNGGGRGCSDMRVTLHLRDHNDAIIREFTFGAGEVADGQTKPFTTTIVGLFGIPDDTEKAATSIAADAQCADKT